MSFNDLVGMVERAKVESLREHRQQFKDAAELLRSLPDLMVQERDLRGLSKRAAALQAGVQENTWGRIEARKTTAHSSTSARVLEWMAGQ